MCYITFRSVTFAQRGEAVLEKAGIRCAMQRTPRWMEEQGCGYCIRLPGAQVHGGIQILRGSHVPFRRVYCQNADGELKELVL